MSEDVTTHEKRMRLRYAGTCRRCGVELSAKVEAVYERATKTVRCLDCPAVEGPTGGANESPAGHKQARIPPDLNPGTPGASARREFERRKAKREVDVRSKHPKFGGLVLALGDDPQSTTAWDVGAIGEERLGRRLNELSSESLRVLHDRRVPNSRANIDHLAITPSGVYVIDAKKYKGRPSLKVEGGLLRPRVEKLLVGKRDCTKLVDGVRKQVDVVRTVIGDGVPIHGVLCFVEADWPLIGGAFTTRGVDALWPKRLYPRLRTEGPLGGECIDALHRRLGSALSPA